MSTWKKCFIATELAEWFCTSQHTKDIDEAVELGETLVESLFIVHVNRDHTFKNEMLFFRFLDDGHDHGHVRKEKDGNGKVTFKSWKQFLDTPHSGKELSPEDLKQMLQGQSSLAH